MKFRTARHTKDLNRMIDFYGRVLGLKVLGSFRDHEGDDGVFLGMPGTDWHIEFTTSRVTPVHYPDNDDLLVFYAESVEEFLQIKDRFIANRVAPVEPKNPYWKNNGITFMDPDGFRIVISVLRIVPKRRLGK